MPDKPGSREALGGISIERDYLVESLMSIATEVNPETLNIRIKPHERSLIDRAAKLRGVLS